jgi:hypothetical protein
MLTFIRNKLNEVKDEEQYDVKVSNRYPAVEYCALRWIFDVWWVPVTTTWSVIGLRMEGPKQRNKDMRLGACAVREHVS